MVKTPIVGVGDPQPVLVKLADVVAQPVSWLWPGRIARGKTTLIVGDPGQGKSFLTLDVASRVSLGTHWPDGVQAPNGHVVVLAAEDGIADTIRPRVDAMGGDTSRLWILQAVRRNGKDMPVSLATDLEALRSAVAETSAVLVIIDPLTAYLGKADTFKDTEVRAVLMPVAKLAEEYDAAIIAVMHLNKGQQHKAIYRTPGSIGFVGLARASFFVVADPKDEKRRFLVPQKFNLGPPPASLAFRIVGTGVEAHIEWEPHSVQVNIESLLASGPVVHNPRDVAAAFLIAFLKAGPAVSTEVIASAKAQGISASTLQRAKSKLGVVSKAIPGPHGPVAWTWSLPESPSVAADLLQTPLPPLEDGNITKIVKIAKIATDAIAPNDTDA
jgi:hypothetical protein